MESTFDFLELILRLRKKAEEGKENTVTCSECGAEMIRRKSKFQEGKYWWGCSNYPRCKNTFKE